MDGTPNIEFSTLSPSAGETVSFPSSSPPGPEPNIEFLTRTPPPGQTLNFGSGPPQGLPPELHADFKTLVEFMQGQKGGAAPPSGGGAAPPGSAAGVRESLINKGAPEWAKAQDISIPKPPAGAAPQGGGAPGMSLGDLPNPKKALVMGALGRLLTAASARIGGGVAGAMAPTAANAKEPADLAKKGLGTGAPAVKMADWDKAPPAPAKKPDAEAPKATTGPAQAGEKPFAAKPADAPKKPMSSFERAFAAAVKDPSKPKVFEWNGKKYRAELAQDVKRKGLKALAQNDGGEADKLNEKELRRVRGQS